jgi:hypothetical protein
LRLGSLGWRAGRAGMGCLAIVLGWAAVALAQSATVRLDLPATLSPGTTVTAEVFIDITDPIPPAAALGAYTIDLDCTPTMGSPTLEIVSPALGGVRGGNTLEFSGPPTANLTASCVLRLGALNFSSTTSPTGAGISVALIDINVLPTANAGDLGEIAVIVSGDPVLGVRDTDGALIPSIGQGSSSSVTAGCATDGDCSDGVLCTTDTCDAATGACSNTAVPGCCATDGDCSDGVLCTTDTCDAATGACSNVPNDAACNDANECTADTCDPVDGCANPPETGLNCTEDGDVCTDDLCDASGMCQSVFDPTNDPSCTPGTTVPTFDGCPLLPQTGCREAKYVDFEIRTDRQRLEWTWLRGEPTPKSAFGDPLSSTHYAVCLYDHLGGEPMLATSLELPPNTSWTDLGWLGWQYKDHGHPYDGIRNLLLIPSRWDLTTLRLRAFGPGVPYPNPVSNDKMFHKDPSVIVQMINSDGECFTSEFKRARRNKKDYFQGR